MSEHIPDPPLHDRLRRGADAAHALSDVLWEALREELAAGDRFAGDSAARAAELSERIAEIAGAVALLAASGPTASSPGRAPAGAEADAAAAGGSRAEAGSPASESRAAGEPSGGRFESVATGPPRTPAGRSWRATAAGGGEEEGELTPAIVVDERSPSGPRGREANERTRASDDPATIEIRDERATPIAAEGAHAGEAGATPWLVSIARRLERHGRDGLPFAVLLLELADVERLRHAELPGEVARLTGLVEAALAAELRPADSLMRESPGRYWLLAPETDTAAAKHLAGRLAAGVRAAASHRGAPLALAVGIAVCPDDGREAAALVARADIALYAAHAIGVAPPPQGQ